MNRPEGVVEIFEAKWPDGEHVVVNVDALNAALDRLNVPTVMVTVTDALRDHVSKNGIEPGHLRRKISAGSDFRPATQIVRRGASYIVDGNHRANLWIKAGSPMIPVRIAPEILWRIYIVRSPIIGGQHAQPI